MTVPRFCGSCGRPLPDPPQSFCPSCGQPVAARAAASAPEVLGFGAPLPPTGGRRRWPVVVAGLGVLALGGGVLAATTLLGGGGSRTVDGSPLPAAVTSEPEESWTYDFDGDYLGGVVGVGDQVVLVDEDGDVVGLDSDGETVWSANDRSVSYVLAVPGHDDLVVVAGGESGGMGALSTDDGHELWWSDSGFPVATPGKGLLVVDGAEESETADLVWTDPESGEDEWRVRDVDNFDQGGDAVFVVKDGELSRLDRDGEEDWSVDVPFDDEEDYVQLVATEDLVALAGDSVVAYDAGGGDELWTYEPDDGDADLTVDSFAKDRILVSESSYDEEDDTSSSTVIVRDREGTVGELDVDDGELVYGSGVESGGTSWFVDVGSGATYDEELELVATYRGALTLADRGVYAIDSNSVAFYEYGEARSSWDLDLPDGDPDSRSVSAVDHAVLVVDDGEVVAYR